ncbi:MAG: carboxypeptidase-like regulatory domain-containing protein [Bryobacteraceae bacterium]|nr:carboxypeptidase-like regulatory domain-containing protein [Bryobacteraceae bacterium]
MKRILALVASLAFCPHADLLTSLSAQTGLAPQRAKGAMVDSATIAGKVCNAITGEGISRAIVLLRRLGPAAGEARSYTTTADETGSFRFRGVDPGAYRFRASRVGYVPGEFGSQRMLDAGSPLTLDAGSKLEGVLLPLSPHAVLSGRVFDERGDPLSYVKVQALTYRYVYGRRQLVGVGAATTNDLGEYRIFGLPSGRYLLSAVLPRQTLGEAAEGERDELDYVPTFYPRGTDPAFATTIQARPGSTLTGIDFMMARAPAIRLRGRIVSPTGAAMITVRLSAVESAVGTSITTITDPTGRFEIGGVSPGAYLISATLHRGEQVWSARQRLVLKSNVDVALDLAPPVEVTGSVRIEGDARADLSGVRIGLEPRDRGDLLAALPQALLKEDGTFRLANVCPDEYYLSVSGLPEGHYLKSVQIGSREVSYEAAVVRADTGEKIALLLNSGAASFDGVVVDRQGQVGAGATIVLVPADQAKRGRLVFYRVTKADTNGRFRMKDISPGTYSLYAWQDIEPGAWMDSGFLEQFADSEKRVTVAEKQQQTVQLKMAITPPTAEGRQNQ